MKKYFIHAGDKFGRWTVIEESKTKRFYYTCRCECGKVKDVPAHNLGKGKSLSCGCLQKEVAKECNCKPIEYTVMGDYVVGKTNAGYEFKFDLEDFEKVKGKNWYRCKNGYIYNKRGKEKAVLMHRYLMNPPSGFVVDHINHDRTDNRKSNLRICTVRENSRNRAVPPKGIITNKSGNNTYYTVFIKGKYFGNYKDYEKAKAVRDEAWGNGYD